MTITNGQITQTPASRSSNDRSSSFERILDKARIGTVTSGPAQSPGQDTRLDHAVGASKDGESPGKYLQADDKTQVPKYVEVTDIQRNSNGSISYTTSNDEKITVEKGLTPKLYAATEELLLTREATQNGYGFLIGEENALGLYEHLHDIDLSRIGEGVITYQQGDTKFVINKSTTPKAFDGLQKLAQLQSFQMQRDSHGATIAPPDYQLPENLRDLKDVTKVGDDLITFTDAQGKRLIVSKAVTPELFDPLNNDIKLKGLLEDATKEGFQEVEDLPDKADLKDLKVISEDTDNALIRFEQHGKKYVISRDAAKSLDANFDRIEQTRFGHGVPPDSFSMPERSLQGSPLYELLSTLHSSEGSPSYDALKSSLDDPAQSLVYRGKDVIGLGGIAKVEVVADGALKITGTSGKTQMVFKALSPTEFEAYQHSGETLSGIDRAKDDGYQLAGNDEYLPSDEDITSIGKLDEYGPGLISLTYQKPGGQERKILVSKELNPEMYGQVTSHQTDDKVPMDNLDELRKENGQPPISDQSISVLKTTEKDKDGDALNVQDLALRDLVDGYRAEIKKGKIGEDDPRARFVRALEAKSMAENGMSIVPEHGVWYEGQVSDPVQVKSRDVREKILDVKHISEQLSELLNNDTIKADMKSRQSEAISKIDGGSGKADEIKQKLTDMAFSEGYAKYIKALQDGGKGEQAQKDLQTTYANLADIDPAKADEFLQEMQSNAYTMDIDKLIDDPSGVSDDNKVLATQDVISNMLKALKAGGSDIPRRVMESYEKLVQELLHDKTKAKAIGDIIASLGATLKKTGKITFSDIDQQTKTYPSLDSDTRNSFIKNLAFLNTTGTLGSMGGTISLTRAIYQVANGQSFGATAAERMGIATDFISFVSAGPHFANLGTRIVDTVLGTQSNELLGLSKSVPEIWAKEKVDKGKGRAYDTPSSKEIKDSFISEINKGSQSNPEAAKRVSKSGIFTDENMHQIFKSVTDKLQKTEKINPKIAYKIAGSTLKVLSAAGDVAGGILGIVTGAFTLSGAIKDGDKVKIASGALGIAGGLGATMGAVASVSAALGISSKVITGLGPVGFLASGVLSIVSAILGFVKDAKLKKMSMENWDQIKEFKKDGLLAENGDDAYVWLQTYLSNYGQRDAPDDQSIFDYRADEWNARSTDLEGMFHHEDYSGDGPNLSSEHDRQPYNGGN